jgi:hypothetical protein
MLRNSRSKPFPLRGAEGAQVVANILADDSPLIVSLAPNRHRQGETDVIMELLLRDYYASRLSPPPELG